MGKHPLCRYAIMGIYINRGNMSFVGARRGEYVDKSELILYINSTLNTESRMTCVSRARRFGKSMAAKMLYAYYDKSCDSRKLFEDLKVANAENPINKNPETAFETHLNKYPTIYIDVTDFTSTYHDNKDIIKILSRTIKKDIREAYPDITISPRTDLMGTLVKVYEHTGEQFILIIDEWDALCRELAKKPQIMEEYVRLLRSLFKSGNTDRVFAAVYMTGILPIKQYGTQSALNNFQPYSMINPDPIGGYYGFTKDEVMALCEKYDMPYQQMEKWYDGYNMGTVSHVFNPTSVMLAIRKRTFDNYWSQTSSFEAIRNYINMDFDGVKQTIENLLIGGEESVPVLNYGNDQNEINSRDELFALLTHYGYFAYDNKTQKVHIPNQEVRAELLQVVKTETRMLTTEVSLQS